MFSLQRLLGQEDKFFDLLEASAMEARHSVQALIAFTKNPDNPKALDELMVTRRKEKAINTEIGQALCTTFITALEREDIEALSTALYKIPKTVEKIAERILMAPQFLKGLDLSRQIGMLDQAATILMTMIQELRKGIRLEAIKKLNDELQHIEGEMDKMVLELLRMLYTKEMEGNKVIFLKDLFELLEKVTDRFRDAGNVMVQIVLKSS
jgi:uncharacterized protein Yka (UPF0111/DUF47 family)